MWEFMVHMKLIVARRDGEDSEKKAATYWKKGAARRYDWILPDVPEIAEAQGTPRWRRDRTLAMAALRVREKTLLGAPMVLQICARRLRVA